MQDKTRPCLHFYALDQTWNRTSSIGIFKYARCLLRALAEGEDPGWDLLVSVNEAEKERLLPAELPGWIRVHICTVGTGAFSRLVSDHIRANRITRQYNCDATFFPKGWIPFRKGGRPVLATVHDAIILHLRKLYPEYTRSLKALYFQTMTYHTLKQADRIFTISDVSAEALKSLVPSAVSRMTVIPLANTFPEPGTPTGPRSGLLVFFSPFPHKRVRETLRLISGILSEQPDLGPLYLVGQPPDGIDLPDGSISLGRLSEAELSNTYTKVNSVIMLSELEGFGLPLLEALAHGASVVYRDRHSFREIMGEKGAGAWDGEPDHFLSSVTEAVQLSMEARAEIYERLSRRYSWTCAADILKRGVSGVFHSLHTHEEG